jgi:DNA-binding NarL/FixJ family response regulator
MTSLHKDDNSSSTVKYFLLVADGDLKVGLDAMLESGVADSYTDAISILLKHWDRRLDCDDALREISANHKKLSKRQKQLVPLLNKGLLNREIADILNLSEHTVKVHLWRFYKKLNVSSRAQLLYVLRENYY